MINTSYAIHTNNINGICQLKGRRVIAFSATTSVAIERFISNCIMKPLIIKFLSEYELLNGISPV